MKCPCCNQSIPEELDKKRRNINWLENRVAELKRMKQYTNLIRHFALDKPNGYSSPELAVAICLEEIFRLMKIDANRKLEKLGVGRIK